VVASNGWLIQIEASECGLPATDVGSLSMLGLFAYHVQVGRASSGAAATGDRADGDDGLHHGEHGDGGSGVRIARLTEKVQSILDFLPCGLGGAAAKGGVVSTCVSCIESDLSR